MHVAYRSQGLDTWRYSLGDEVAEVREFNLNLNTNFDGFDFPENTLSPTEKKPTKDGWLLTWTYRNLLSGFEIGVKLPEKPQPGPLAGQISFFAPVSLFFFFFLVFILTMLRGIEVHPMNYFFLACAFFAFHLLLAYLVDHISIHVAFLICSAMSLFLVWSYLQAGRGNPLRLRSCGRPIRLPGALFVCLLFQGLHGSGSHDRRNLNSVHRDANHGPDPLGGEIRTQSRIGGSCLSRHARILRAASSWTFSRTPLFFGKQDQCVRRRNNCFSLEKSSGFRLFGQPDCNCRRLNNPTAQEANKRQKRPQRSDCPESTQNPTNSRSFWQLDRSFDNCEIFSPTRFFLCELTDSQPNRLYYITITITYTAFCYPEVCKRHKTN